MIIQDNRTPQLKLIKAHDLELGDIFHLKDNPEYLYMAIEDTDDMDTVRCLDLSDYAITFFGEDDIVSVLNAKIIIDNIEEE